MLSHIPMAQAGTSEEMAAVTTFLVSDEAAYITGQTLCVDGGLTLYTDNFVVITDPNFERHTDD